MEKIIKCIFKCLNIKAVQISDWKEWFLLFGCETVASHSDFVTVILGVSILGCFYPRKSSGLSLKTQLPTPPLLLTWP